MAASSRCGTTTAVAPAVELTDARARWVAGVLTVGSRRYAVGEPGDDVLLGRWSCGPPTVALLRRAAGDVVAFDRLPDAGPVVGRVVARVPGARQLATRRTTEGCTDLAVVDADGRSVPVSWKEAS